MRLLRRYFFRRTLSTWAGAISNSKVKWFKKFSIRLFIKLFNINIREIKTIHPADYESFNAFFTRALLPEARPIALAPIISPVDGILTDFGPCLDQLLLQAKHHSYSVAALLAAERLSDNVFQYYLTFYLSPKHYHRVHMPISGTLHKMVYIPGAFFSVKPSYILKKANVFTRNERVVCYFSTEMGPFALILIGAFLVGSIVTAWHGPVINKDHTIKVWEYSEPIRLLKGQEMGYFRYGSTVITLFSDPNIDWLPLHLGQEYQLGQALSE